jgi:hypothetical protein
MIGWLKFSEKVRDISLKHPQKIIDLDTDFR